MFWYPLGCQNRVIRGSGWNLHLWLGQPKISRTSYVINCHWCHLWRQILTLWVYRLGRPPTSHQHLKSPGWNSTINCLTGWTFETWDSEVSKYVWHTYYSCSEWPHLKERERHHRDNRSSNMVLSDKVQPIFSQLIPTQINSKSRWVTTDSWKNLCLKVEINQWWNATSYQHMYNFEVFYFSISIFCYFW